MIQWDTETRQDVAPTEGRIREERIYLTTALLAEMEDTWGGVLTHVKTSTDTATGEVTVFKAEKDEPGATPLRRTHTLNAGDFSFWRPLHKLNLKVPDNRQFVVTPFTRTVVGLGTVYVFPMNDRVSAPRNRQEEVLAEQVAPTAE